MIDSITDPAVVSLTIVKCTGTSTDTRDSGTNTSTSCPAGQQPVTGATYTATLVDTESLYTTEGWADVSTITAAFQADTSVAPPLTTTKKTLVESPAGVYTLTGVDVGLYLITEDAGDANPTADFLVSLPMVDPSNSANWLYAVTVHPKGGDPAEATIEKTAFPGGVPTQGQTIGSTVPWSIMATIPANSDISSGVVITDQLPDGLALVGNVAVTIEPAGDLVAATPAQVATSDGFTVTLEADGVDVTSAETTVTLTFNTTVTTDLNTTVLKVDGQDDVNQGEQVNTANVAFADDPVDTDDDVVKFGGAAIHKFSSAPSTTGDDVFGTLLSGASFQVFATQAEADAASAIAATGTAPDPGTDGAITAKMLNGTSTNVFTTGADDIDDGSVGILGLYFDYSSFDLTGLQANSNGDVFAGTRCARYATDLAEAMYGTTYWAVETAAPAGYVLDATPIPICLVGDLDGDSAAEYTADDQGSYDDWNIFNEPANAGFNLPFTGAQQAIILTVIGVAVVLFAFFILRRRNDEEEEEVTI
jgi:fimbrial isopeptide formation D2 family protein/LPXTG-motif cell wall-anchored protein